MLLGSGLVQDSEWRIVFVLLSLAFTALEYIHHTMYYSMF